MWQRLLVWLISFGSGSLVGLGLRLVSFLVGVLVVQLAGNVLARLVPVIPAFDPVYSLAAAHSLADLHLRGLVVHGPMVRLAVERGSPVLGRLVASGFAHAVVLTAGLLVVRRGWRRRNTPLVLAGFAMQLQVAIGILAAQPSIRELDATGVSFAANALLPTLAPRGAALSDVPAGASPPLVSAALVALALLIGYLPISLVLLLRDRARRITVGSAAVVLLGSAACAGVLNGGGTATDAAPVTDAVTLPAAVTLTEAVAFDRWFDEPASSQPAAEAQPAAAPPPAATPTPVPSPSHVEVVGSDFHYQYLVNGEPQVIKGMGLNTQYSHQLSPEDRAARIDADMAEMSALGVNTVLGWDPSEFDQVLLDAAQRHGIGVVMPFDLNPDADYTDPAVRQRLHDEALAWVMQYHNHPAVRMWGLGNEVLHKIVHPAWVGPQDPAQERQAEAFSDWLVWTADDIHALDPDHPVTYRSAEDAFVQWVIDALDRRGGGPRPWFVWGTNCYQAYLSDIIDHWTQLGMPTALWVSEFAPGAVAVPDRPDGFATMWGYIRRNPDFVLGGAVYAWTRNGPEGVDRNFGLTDDGVPVDGQSLDMLSTLFHSG